MKTRVVGWADYDDPLIEDGDITLADYVAIIEEMKEKGYSFSGYDHQETPNCAPVMNDGKRRCFSQRGWGGLVAETYGETEPYSYAGYTFKMNAPKCPPASASFDPTGFVPEADLNEEFRIDVLPEQMERARTRGEIRLLPKHEYRFLAKGDTLVLSCGQDTACFPVEDVSKERDLAHGELINLFIRMRDEDEEKANLAKTEFDQIPIVLIIKLSSPDQR